MSPRVLCVANALKSVQSSYTGLVGSLRDKQAIRFHGVGFRV